METQVYEQLLMIFLLPVLKSPQLTDRDVPYFSSNQSQKTNDSSIYQIMQALNKNATKSTSYLTLSTKNENVSPNLNRSKSPQQKQSKSKQNLPNTSYSQLLEFIRTPSSTLHKPTFSAIQSSQDRYNLAQTSQEISKQILQNLRQTKNKSDMQVKQSDSGSFVVNKVEQEKLNCNMCFRKDIKIYNNNSKMNDQQLIQVKQQRNLGFCKLESLKIQLTDENDFSRQLLNVNSQLSGKMTQLKKLYDHKQKEWIALVDQLKNEYQTLVNEYNKEMQFAGKSLIIASPDCLRNCKVLLQMTPVDVSFESLFTQTNQQLNCKYDKLIKDLYSKLQIHTNADLILKQLAQNGKQNERTYLKLIEDLRQKYNKQQKLISDTQTLICDQNARLSSVQDCIKLISDLINNSENLKNYKLKNNNEESDFEDVLAILQQLDQKASIDQKRIDEQENLLNIKKIEWEVQENEMKRQINELRDTIEAMEMRSIDSIKQRVSLNVAQEERNVIKELAMIILSKNIDGDVQDKVAGILRKSYGDILYKNELQIQELQQKNMLLMKQLEFEVLIYLIYFYQKEQTQTLRKQLNHFYEKFMLISKSFDCLPKRLVETNEFLQMVARTILQAKPLIIQEYVEMQSTQSDQEDDFLTRQSLTIEEANNSKNLARSSNQYQSNKSLQNNFSSKNKEDDFHYMLLLQAITIEEYVYLNRYQTNEQNLVEAQQVQQLRPQFSFTAIEKCD